MVQMRLNAAQAEWLRWRNAYREALGGLFIALAGALAVAYTIPSLVVQAAAVAVPAAVALYVVYVRIRLGRARAEHERLRHRSSG